MATFPLFVDLKNKKCVVVGGGRVATRKTETLLQFCDNIVVVSPDISDKLAMLIQKGSITYIESTFYPEALENAFIAIAATSDKRVNESIHKLAVEKNCLVNVADAPDKCTFIFPSVVKRDELVIGISTSGGFPALSKAIREKIEGMLPELISEKLKVLKTERKDILKGEGNALLKKQRLEDIIRKNEVFQNESDK